MEEPKVDRRKIPKADRDPPTTGQSGPSIHLNLEDMTENEALIVTRLGDGGSCTIAELAEALIDLGTEECPAHAKLLIRNALRRLVRSRWVERVERGKYQSTARASDAGQKSEGE